MAKLHVLDTQIMNMYLSVITFVTRMAEVTNGALDGLNREAFLIQLVIHLSFIHSKLEHLVG